MVVHARLMVVELGGADGVCQTDGRGEKVQWCVPGRQQRQERLIAWARLVPYHHQTEQ